MNNSVASVKSGLPPLMLLLFPLIAALALTSALFWSTFTWWWWEWNYPGSFYAHALFVPFFVAAMLWRDRTRIAAARWNPSWYGMLYVALGVPLMLAGLRLDVTTIQSIAFMLILLGICNLTIGRTRTNLLLFPLLFILLMMPLVPDQLINSVAFPIQVLSAKMAAALLNILQLHAVRQGTLIQMESYRLAVELPCSGFKTLVSLLTFTAAFAYLTDAARWKRWTLFLTTIPLSIVINALRITFIGVVGELFSTKAALTFHDYSGFIVLVLAFTFLYNFAKVLKCERFLGFRLDEGANADQKEEAPETPVQHPTWQEIVAWRPSLAQSKRLQPYLFGLNAALLIALGIRAAAIRPIPAQPPIGRNQVPTRLITPRGDITYEAVDDVNNDKLTKVVQETLTPTRVISRTYQGTDGSRLMLFITAGNGRKVFHDPHTCMLGGDKVMRDIALLAVPTSLGPVQMLESRYRDVQNPEETEMLICYAVEGRTVPRTEDVRNRIVMQTLFGDSGIPSYFVRVTQVRPGSSPKQREEIINFAGAVWGQIGPILLGKAPGNPADGPPEPITEETANAN